MDSKLKLIINKTEARIIIDALNFAADNFDFKNAHFITTNEIALITKQIKMQIKQKPKLSSHDSINEITTGWK